MKVIEVQAVRFCRTGAAAVSWLSDDSFSLLSGDAQLVVLRAEAVWLVSKLDELLQLDSQQRFAAAKRPEGGRHATD